VGSAISESRPRECGHGASALSCAGGWRLPRKADRTRRAAPAGTLCIPAFERKGEDVVHFEGVRNIHEVASARTDTQRVAARLVYLREEAELLQRLEEVDRAAHPVSVPANRLLPGYPSNRFDVVSDETHLLIDRELQGAKMRQKSGPEKQLAEDAVNPSRSKLLVAST
jgi:hypothetical protein